MDKKNFDRVFYFTYTPSLSTNQFQGALNIDFSGITNQYDIVDLKQCASNLLLEDFNS